MFTNIDWKYIPSLCNYTETKYNNKKNNYILFSKNKSINGLINKDYLGKYRWSDLYEYNGIVHIPYNYSTMSIFEQYAANVPLFFPSKKYLTNLFVNKQAMTEISFLQVFKKQPEDLLEVYGNPNLYNNLNIFCDNIDLCDYYNQEWMPHITYFDSDEHLNDIFKNINLQDITIKMQNKNIERKENIIKLWKTII